MLRSSLIIPTYNRPEELENCIGSVLQQTILPDEIIIIDDGNLTERTYEAACQKKGIHTIYYKKDTPGLTKSRNRGVSLSSGDILFFLDDDVILLPDYIEQILTAYDEKTSGVGGLIENIPPVTLKNSIRRFFEKIFLMTGNEAGKVLPSGFFTEYGVSGHQIKEIKKVDFLMGGVMSFRREIFNEFTFNEKYNEYGAGEDKDFSYKVAQKYDIKVNPKARLYHMEVAHMKPDDMKITRMFLIGHYLFFKDYLKKGWWSWFFFHYALFGYTLIKVIYLIVHPKKKTLSQVKGAFMAYKAIFTGNTLTLTGEY